MGLARRLKVTPALVVACLALLVALSSTAVATTTQLITGAGIKNNSITGKDVKNKSLTPKDFKGSVRGPRGLRGATGATGAAGAKGDKGDKGDPGNNSLVAFANVNGSTVVPTIRSFGGQGTTGASVTKCGAGCYDVTFTGSYPGATSRDKLSTLATVDTDFFDWASTSLNASPVPTTSQITIRTFTLTTSTTPPTAADRDFAVQVLVP